MSFKHFWAVKTLNGSPLWWLRKCRFSVTSASAPTHSVYAAIKASAALSPLASYLKAISKGTTTSSSIVVNALIKFMNSRKDSGDKLRLTSSNIVRGIRAVCECAVSSSFSMNFNDTGSFEGPKANIYSLESITKRKFFFPDFFSCFTQLFDNLVLTHFINGRRIWGNYLSDLFKMSFGAFGVRFCFFHDLSPLKPSFSECPDRSLSRDISKEHSKQEPLLHKQWYLLFLQLSRGGMS